MIHRNIVTYCISWMVLSNLYKFHTIELDWKKYIKLYNHKKLILQCILSKENCLVAVLFFEYWLYSFVNKFVIKLKFSN